MLLNGGLKLLCYLLILCHILERLCYTSQWTFSILFFINSRKKIMCNLRKRNLEDWKLSVWLRKHLKIIPAMILFSSNCLLYLLWIFRWDEDVALIVSTSHSDMFQECFEDCIKDIVSTTNAVTRTQLYADVLSESTIHWWIQDSKSGSCDPSEAELRMSLREKLSSTTAQKLLTLDNFVHFYGHFWNALYACQVTIDNRRPVCGRWIFWYFYILTNAMNAYKDCIS